MHNFIADAHGCGYLTLMYALIGQKISGQMNSLGDSYAEVGPCHCGSAPPEAPSILA